MTSKPLDRYFLTVQIPDISTADTIYVPVPSDGKLVGAKGCLGGAITGADADITFNKNGGATLETMTVAQSGSGAGDIDSVAMDEPVSEGDYIAVATDGASTNAVEEVITLEFTRLTF